MAWDNPLLWLFKPFANWWTAIIAIIAIVLYIWLRVIPDMKKRQGGGTSGTNYQYNQ